jgi:hypothetical protein
MTTKSFPFQELHTPRKSNSICDIPEAGTCYKSEAAALLFLSVSASLWPIISNLFDWSMPSHHPPGVISNLFGSPVIGRSSSPPADGDQRILRKAATLRPLGHSRGGVHLPLELRKLRLTRSRRVGVPITRRRHCRFGGGVRWIVPTTNF